MSVFLSQLLHVEQFSSKNLKAEILKCQTVSNGVVFKKLSKVTLKDSSSFNSILAPCFFYCDFS